MMNYAELNNLFRESFGPLNQLGAGRLALAEGAAQRDYAERIAEERRNAALQDHIAGLVMQDRFARSRQGEANQQALNLEQIRHENALYAGQANAGANEEAQKNAARIHNAAILHAKAIEDAKTYALTDIDPDSPTFVNDVTKQVAKINDTYRKSATAVAKEKDSYQKKIEALNAKLDLTEDEQVRIAKPLMLKGAFNDEKILGKMRGLTKLEDILAAAGEYGQAEKVAAALNKAQDARTRSVTTQLRPLVTQVQSLDRHLEAFSRKGITPDLADNIPVDMGAAAPAVEKPLGLDNIDDVVPRKGPAAGAGAPPSKSDGGSWLGLLGGGAGALTSKAVRKSIGTGLAKVSPYLARAIPSLSGGFGAAIPVVGQVAGAGIGAYQAGKMINSATNNFVPNTMAGLYLNSTGQDFNSELGRQKNALAAIDGLVQQARARGDSETALRLNSLKYSPDMLDDSVLRAMSSGAGRSFMPVGAQ